MMRRNYAFVNVYGGVVFLLEVLVFLAPATVVCVPSSLFWCFRVIRLIDLSLASLGAY
jgi:hypothetical protein